MDLPFILDCELTDVRHHADISYLWLAAPSIITDSGQLLNVLSL